MIQIVIINSKLIFINVEKENEIREVEGEKDFNHKILNSLIKTMNLPMIFVNKEGTIIFTNQSFRDAFKIQTFAR